MSVTLQVSQIKSLPWVPFWKCLQLGNLTASSEQMLPVEMEINVKYLEEWRWETCNGAVQAMYAVTLLYEMASKSSLICAGFWMSSSLEDRGWEEAKASIAKTRWTSFSTMRSFYYLTNQTLVTKTQLITVTLVCHYNNLWGHDVGGKALPRSTQVQQLPLPGTQHRMQSLHLAISHSTTSGWQDCQTTKGTGREKVWLLWQEN